MPQLSKKTLIIIAVVVVIVIMIIVVDVFLFMKYRQSQEQAKTQAKITADIQEVQQTIQSGQIAQINIEDLKQLGYAEEAVSIAEQAIKEEEEMKVAEELRIEQEKPIEEKALDIYKNFSTTTWDNQQVLDDLLSLGDNLIPSLQKNLNVQDLVKRYDTYSIINFIAFKEEDKRQELVPLIKKGLTDSSPAIRASSASWLLEYGEQDGFPVLIELLDEKYSNILVVGEPPIYANQFALDSLYDFSEGDFLTDQQKWQKWWEENKNKLQYDKLLREYK